MLTASIKKRLDNVREYPAGSTNMAFRRQNGRGAEEQKRPRANADNAFLINVIRMLLVHMEPVFFRPLILLAPSLRALEADNAAVFEDQDLVRYAPVGDFVIWDKG